MNIGTAIRSVRKQMHITQYDLSIMCGISQTSLSQIETGTKRPSSKSIKKICKTLEIPESIIYIIGMQDSDVPESKQNVYNLLFPTIKNLVMQVVSDDHAALLG